MVLISIIIGDNNDKDILKWIWISIINCYKICANSRILIYQSFHCKLLIIAHHILIPFWRLSQHQMYYAAHSTFWWYRFLNSWRHGDMEQVRVSEEKRKKKQIPHVLGIVGTTIWMKILMEFRCIFYWKYLLEFLQVCIIWYVFLDTAIWHFPRL